MKYFFLAFLFLLFVNIQGQVNKLLYHEYDIYSSNIVKINSNYYTCTSNTPSFPRGMRLLKLNDLGATLIEKTIQYDTLSLRVNRKALAKKNGNLIVCSDFSIDIGVSQIGITVFDENLDTIWSEISHVEEVNIDILVRDIINTSDNGFAICGAIGSASNHYQAFLLKTDSLGNKEWIGYYGYSNNDQFRTVIETNTHNFIIAGSSYKYHQSFDDWYIVCTDSLGNQIWDWVLRNPENDVSNLNNLNDGSIADLIQTQDGNFIAVGGKSYTNDPFLLKKARLLKFDIDKNVIIDTFYTEVYENDGVDAEFESQFVKIREKENGNLLILNKRQAKPGDNGYRISNLYELNQELSVISKRNFGVSSISPNSGEYLRDFIIEDDGSLALIGDVYLNSYFWDAPYQRVWFVKTDNNYCDGFGSCDTNLTVHFFPNDTIYKTDTVNLEFEIISNWDIEYDIIFTFYNKDFYRIKHDSVLNILANDIYQLEVSYNNLIEEDLFPNSEIGDTVYILSLIMPSDKSSKALYYTTIQQNRIVFIDPNGIAELRSNKTGFRIFPNPAKDFVRVKRNDLESNFCQIFDLTGKLILEQKVESLEFEISVSKLEKGIYYMKIGTGIKKLIIE